MVKKHVKKLKVTPYTNKCNFFFIRILKLSIVDVARSHVNGSWKKK